MGLPRDVWTRVRETLDVADVADLVGLRPMNHHRTRWECPAHGPSSQCVALERVLHCHNCDESWSTIDLAALVWKLDPESACRELAARFNISIPNEYTSAGRISTARRASLEARPPRPKTRLQQVEEELSAREAAGERVARPANIYRVVVDELLTLGERARRYLEGRGFDGAAAAAYGFREVGAGVAWRTLAEALHARYSPLELERAGLYKPDRADREQGAGAAVAAGLPFAHPHFDRPPALLLPYVYRGAVVGLRFRRLDTYPKGRYMSLTEATPPVPFGADALDLIEVAGGRLHLVEGELNAWALRLYGEHAIGLPGAGGWRADWTDRWADALRAADMVFAWYDGDDAGDVAVWRLAERLAERLGEDWVRQRAHHVRTPKNEHVKLDANDLHLHGHLDAVLGQLVAGR